jgi:sugar O-acyltransferase (sialic acid O-acetyltransferase NeuD family)
MNNKKLIIIGTGETAEMAYEYFTYDSDYDIYAFSVDEQYIQTKTLFGCPVIALDKLEQNYPPDIFDVFIAISYTKLNRVRSQMYERLKKMGYCFSSYVSSKAFVWRNVQLGDNCFILENNVIQSNVKIGNNVYVWSGNHIGHRSEIDDHCYISSHVTISGFCKINKNCFVGVNSCINDKIHIAQDCIIGSGAVVVKNTDPGKVYIGNPAAPMKKDSFTAFNV